MEPLKLLLFGSTGLIGNAVLRQALERGHKVTAVVRSKERMKDFTHDNLTVTEGNSMDKNTFDDSMAGQDAVISCISARGRMYVKVNLYSVSVKEIHESMVKNGVKRCVFMSGWGVGPSRHTPWYMSFIMLFMKNHLNDMLRMEHYLTANKEEMNFTVVRPPGVSSDPMTEGELVTVDDDSYIPGCLMKLSRENVAKFILDSLESKEYEGRGISIGIKA